MTSGAVAPVIECPQCHEDGTVDYWCPRRQRLVCGVKSVPADGLALMPDSEAARVRKHVWHHWGIYL